MRDSRDQDQLGLPGLAGTPEPDSPRTADGAEETQARGASPDPDSASPVEGEVQGDGSGSGDRAPADETSERDPLLSRVPFAMGKVNPRTSETHLVDGASANPIPGPWTLKAVVRESPGSAKTGKKKS